MSVFNENGALVYANNSYTSNASLDSIIAESARMDSALEGIVMESIGQFDAANIVLETVGYFDESVKEVIANGAAKAWEALLKALDSIANVLSSLAPSKKIILANKKKIIEKFDEVKNLDNDNLKQCIKNYNSVAKLDDSSTLLKKIDEAIDLANEYGNSFDELKKKMGTIIGISIGDNWKVDIKHEIEPDYQPSDDVSSINITNVIDTATSIDKNIPAIKQKRREVENSIKAAEKALKTGSDEKTAGKLGLSMVCLYCVTAIKSLKLLALYSTKLCLAVLKCKSPKNKDSKKDTEE